MQFVYKNYLNQNAIFSRALLSSTITILECDAVSFVRYVLKKPAASVSKTEKYIFLGTPCHSFHGY
jgi:hypothetical protein